MVDRGEVVPLTWPAGCEGRLDPPEIVDEAGQVVARVGETICISGSDIDIDPEIPFSMGKSRGFYIHHFFPPALHDTDTD
jgi:hypothetical protein